MGLGVIRALGENGIPVIAVYYDPQDMGYHSRYAVERIPAPHPEKDEAAFLAFLDGLAARYPGAVLFPVSDESLVTVSRHKQQLDRCFRVACASWDIVQKMIDKKYTYALAESVGVPVPKTIVPKSLEDVQEYARTIDYPCLLKPSKSHEYFAHFRKKMVWAASYDQLLAAYIEARDAGFEVMLQEFIPGEDSRGVNYNSYFWDGRPLVEFTAQKVRSAPPVIGSPCVAYSDHVTGVLEHGRKMLAAFGFYGYSCAEFKLDPRDGIYKLMEVNGRHNLSTLLAVRCGLNFPLLHYHHLVDGVLPVSRDYKLGVYWIDLSRDLAFGARQLLRSPQALPDFLAPYFKPHVHAVLDWHDLKPFLKHWRALGSRALSNPLPFAKAK